MTVKTYFDIVHTYMTQFTNTLTYFTHSSQAMTVHKQFDIDHTRSHIVHKL